MLGTRGIERKTGGEYLRRLFCFLVYLVLYVHASRELSSCVLSFTDSPNAPPLLVLYVQTIHFGALHLSELHSTRLRMASGFCTPPKSMHADIQKPKPSIRPMRPVGHRQVLCPFLGMNAMPVFRIIKPAPFPMLLLCVVPPAASDERLFPVVDIYACFSIRNECRTQDVVTCCPIQPYAPWILTSPLQTP